jgi:hypothetical protein
MRYTTPRQSRKVEPYEIGGSRVTEQQLFSSVPAISEDPVAKLRRGQQLMVAPIECSGLNVSA